jgi:hypothetical protein
MRNKPAEIDFIEAGFLLPDTLSSQLAEKLNCEADTVSV